MGSCLSCEADESSVKIPVIGSFKIKHCFCLRQDDAVADRKTDEEKQFEIELQQLHIGLRVERRKREYNEKIAIEAFIRGQGRLPDITEIRDMLSPTPPSRTLSYPIVISQVDLTPQSPPIG